MEKIPKSNQFPFESHHLNHLAQAFGPEIVNQVEYMLRIYAKDGGCSPNAVKLVFPDGPEGKMNEEMLHLVLGNFAAWHDLN